MVASLPISPKTSQRDNQRKHYERWTGEQIKTIQSFVETGITYEQINELANRWGRHPDTIYSQVKRQGIKLNFKKRSFRPEEKEIINRYAYDQTVNFPALFDKLNRLASDYGWEPPRSRSVYMFVSTLRKKAFTVKFTDGISVLEISEYLKVNPRKIDSWIARFPEILLTDISEGKKVVSLKSFKDFALTYPGEIEEIIPGSFGLLALLA